MKVLKIIVIFILTIGLNAQIIVNHSNTNLSDVPDNWIETAKSNLHIAYGHTSHGSQLTTGMAGLVDFTGGVGGPQFAWNNGGSNNALDLHDYAMDGDCGRYPSWVNNTRNYLDNSSNADVNVIIWSWCGEISGYSSSDLITKYLAPMTQLEIDYPNVKFVYMTGHLNYWSHATTNTRNQEVRDYCLANNKVLYDFADIESYNPDGVYYEYTNDDCGYYSNWNNGYIGNWAQEWQNSHTEGVDWYTCTSAHSEPLNANQKAYAAWNLWARLAGWSGQSSVKDSKNLLVNDCELFQNYPNPFNPSTKIHYQLTVNANKPVKIAVYNVSGQKVWSTSITHNTSSVTGFCTFDASLLNSGIYYYSLIVDEEVVLTKPMVFLK